MTIKALRRDRKASTLPEAAIVFGVLFPMLVGGIDVGVMMWTKATMQSVAALTARCRSVAAVSAGCDTDDGAAAYGYRLATAWLSSGMVPAGAKTGSGVFASVTPASTVSVTVSSATSCYNASGTFKKVQIHSEFWFGAILHPIAGPAKDQTACYPSLT